MSSAKKTPAQWKEEVKLSATESAVIWDKGTERPGTGEYEKFYPKKGYFACKVCKTPLYSAESKFNSGCGWPSFDQCYENSVRTYTDDSLPGRPRIEITCKNCDAHLGHVFKGEGMTKNNERHCVNSISVIYVDEEPPQSKQVKLT